jgi:hypothetical protein
MATPTKAFGENKMKGHKAVRVRKSGEKENIQF